jgi:hypothetical protein
LPSQWLWAEVFRRAPNSANAFAHRFRFGARVQVSLKRAANFEERAFHPAAFGRNTQWPALAAKNRQDYLASLDAAIDQITKARLEVGGLQRGMTIPGRTKI